MSGPSDNHLDDRYRLGPLITNTPVVAVHTAVDLRLGRDVCVRMLREASAVDARDFEAAARAVAALEHPNVCPVWDIGRLGGRSCTVTEPLIRSLADEVQARPIAEARLVEIALGCLAALQVVHEIGVVHGPMDIASITIDDTAVPKLSDFTRSAATVGTDVCAEVGLSPADDLASLARVLLHALDESALQHGPVAGIFKQASSQRPAGRFRAAAEMADAIRSANSGAAVDHGDLTATPSADADATVAMTADAATASTTPTTEQQPTQIATTAVLPHEPPQRRHRPVRTRLHQWWAMHDSTGRSQMVGALVAVILLVIVLAIAFNDEDPALPGSDRRDVPEHDSGEMPPEVPR